MNILFLCHRIPYPPDKGDKIRSFNEVKYLSGRHKLFLAFLVDDERDVAYVDELKKYCAEIDYDIISPRRQKIKSIPYLLTNKALSIPYFYSTRLQHAIDKRLKETEIDAVICFSSPMAEYVFSSDAINQPRQNGGKIKLIIDFVDVDSDKWRIYSEYSSMPASFIYRREWKKLMAYEKKAGEKFDVSIFVSDEERRLYQSFAPGVKTATIPNGVDISYFSNNFKKSADGGKGCNILFTGAMDYFPNVDGVLYFYEAIWPFVKKNLPEARFYIVGSNPSRKLMRLSEIDSNIQVTGYVNDVREYMRLADVFVAPLRIARGVQNKVLEAMAAGLPVVATSQAVQGLSGYNGCLRVEIDAEGFATSIIEIITDQGKRQRMVNDAKRFIFENHNWGKTLRKFEKIIE